MVVTARLWSHNRACLVGQARFNQLAVALKEGQSWLASILPSVYNFWIFGQNPCYQNTFPLKTVSHFCKMLKMLASFVECPMTLWERDTSGGIQGWAFGHQIWTLVVKPDLCYALFFTKKLNYMLCLFTQVLNWVLAICMQCWVNLWGTSIPSMGGEGGQRVLLHLIALCYRNWVN